MTVSASSDGVDGQVKNIDFINSKPIFQQGPGGGGTITVSTAAPPPPYGFALDAGTSREFDVPIRATAVGAVNIVAKTFGSTPLFEDRNAEQTIQVQVTADPPPPPLTFVCGFDVLTHVSSTSTGTTLNVDSAASIDPGAELLVDPCAANAEQVSVSSLAGTQLALAAAMKSVHVAKAPVVLIAPGRTILRKAAAVGASEIDVLKTDLFAVGDHVRIDPGTGVSEDAVVTGFGSLLVDPPLAHPHDTGAVVVLLPACASPQGSGQDVACSTTTLPACPAECGDANEDGKLTAGDALVALKAAVGQRSCEPCLCDANASGTITATDALAILKRAVGAVNSLSCALPGS